VGLDGGAIGLSGVKKFDLRVAGEGGMRARLSIVRSDSDGREGLRTLGVFGSSADEMVLWSSPFWKVCPDELLEAVRKLSNEVTSSSAVLFPLEPDVWRDLTDIGFLKRASWVTDAVRPLNCVVVNGGRFLGSVEAVRGGTLAFLGRGRRDARGIEEDFAAAIDGREEENEASSMAADQICCRGFQMGTQQAAGNHGTWAWT
jgi:hypothetical protein